tara:strand:+ start:617 stop:1018 length:402 start_codon:yes stop_codon:yes gene_type:complete
MAISKIIKKVKPKARPKVKPKPKPKKKLSPMMRKLEIQRIKSNKFSEADAKRLLKYDDDLTDALFKEAFRDSKATGGRVKKKVSPPKARPLPRPKVLPPRRPRGTAPRLPSMKDLTPEQRKKLLQLIKGMRRK